MKNNNYQFIHICPDEKFIDSAISLFNQSDKDNHKFIVVSKKKNLLYIKSKELLKLSPIKIILYILTKRKKLKDKILVLHSAPRISKLISLLVHKKTKIVWIGFGYDYYHFNNINNIKIKPSIIINNIFLQRVNFFSPVLEEEFSILKKYHPNFSATVLNWNYDVVTDFFKKNFSCNGNNILLGNSATATNNHIEIIKQLSSLNIDEKRKIIIPLSYGSNDYKNKILNILEDKKLNTYPLVNYLKINDYYSYICSCSHVIMNHERQQAYGNIMISLFLGCKVFLKKTNPIYHHLKNKNFIIYSTDEIKNEINVEMTELNKISNKKLILKYFSREMFLYRTKKFINDIKNK